MQLIARIVAEVHAITPPRGSDLVWTDKQIQEEFAATCTRLGRMFPPSWKIKIVGQVLPVQFTGDLVQSWGESRIADDLPNVQPAQRKKKK